MQTSEQKEAFLHSWFDVPENVHWAHGMSNEVEKEVSESFDRAIAAMNTRPVAPIDGLETVTTITDKPASLFFPIGTELVTRSQAETIIAAERAEKERLAALLHKNGTPRFNAVCERAERAEADNAALTEQVKELEETKDVIAADKKTLLDLAATNGDKVTALETQLAAVKEAAAQAAYRACAETRHFKLGEKAATAVRAALEGQP